MDSEGNSRYSSPAAATSDENVQEVIEIWGGLWELPLDMGEALGDSCLSQCLLFYLQRYFDDFYGYMAFEQWGHKYRIVKEEAKRSWRRKKKEHYITAATPTSAHEIDTRKVLFVTGARFAPTVNEEEVSMNVSNGDDDDAEVVNITLPATHLVVLDMHMPTEVIQHLNLESIVTLALPAKLLTSFHDRLLLPSPPTMSRLPLHLLIFRIDKEDRKKFVQDLLHICLSLHLEGLVLGSSAHHDSTAPALWREVIHQLSSQDNQLAYLGMQ